MDHKMNYPDQHSSRRSNKALPLPKGTLVMNLCGRCLKNWMDSGRYCCRRKRKNPDEIKDFCVFCDTYMGFEYALIPKISIVEQRKSHIGQNSTNL